MTITAAAAAATGTACECGMIQVTVRLAMQGVVRHLLAQHDPTHTAGRSRCPYTVGNTKASIVLVWSLSRGPKGVDNFTPRTDHRFLLDDLDLSGKIDFLICYDLAHVAGWEP